MRAYDIAGIAHEANRELQRVQLSVGEDNGVPVAPEWAALPVAEQAVVVDGVYAAFSGKSPEEMHENWARYKVAQGWVYGPVKDAEAKTHPCLVPYGELPASQRKKDDLFRAICLALES